jgi:hypothetical protein
MTDILEPALAGTRLTSHAAVEAMQTVRVATPASRSWMLRYRLILLASDVVAIGLATIIGYTVRFAGADPTLNYDLYAAGLVLGWLVAMQGSGAYDIRHLATGPTEAKVVLRASGIAISVMAVYCYATKTEVARGFVVGVVPVGVALLLLGRGAVRHTVGLRLGAPHPRSGHRGFRAAPCRGHPAGDRRRPADRRRVCRRCRTRQ